MWMSSVLETTILDELSSDQTAEAELVRRAQKNPDQFARLYDRYIQKVYRFYWPVPRIPQRLKI